MTNRFRYSPTAVDAYLHTTVSTYMARPPTYSIEKQWVPGVPGKPAIPAIPSKTTVDYLLGWNAGGSSVRSILMGRAEFTVAINTVGAIVGLAINNTRTTQNDIAYGVIVSNNRVGIVINGRVKWLSTPPVSSRYIIERTDNMVYIRAGSVLLKSLPEQYPVARMVLDAALYAGGDVVKDPVLVEYLPPIDLDIVLPAVGASIQKSPSLRIGLPAVRATFKERVDAGILEIQVPTMQLSGIARPYIATNTLHNTGMLQARLPAIGMRVRQTDGCTIALPPAAIQQPNTIVMGLPAITAKLMGDTASVGTYKGYAHMVLPAIKMFSGDMRGIGTLTLPPVHARLSETTTVNACNITLPPISMAAQPAGIARGVLGAVSFKNYFDTDVFEPDTPTIANLRLPAIALHGLAYVYPRGDIHFSLQSVRFEALSLPTWGQKRSTGALSITLPNMVMVASESTDAARLELPAVNVMTPNSTVMALPSIATQMVAAPDKYMARAPKITLPAPLFHGVMSTYTKDFNLSNRLRLFQAYYTAQYSYVRIQIAGELFSSLAAYVKERIEMYSMGRIISEFTKTQAFREHVKSIVEQVAISHARDGRALGYETWVINLRTGAISRYDEYGFNSFAQSQNDTLAANEQGLYVLGGKTDDGGDIQSSVDFGTLPLTSRQLKHVSNVYLLGMSDKALNLKVEVNDGESYTYTARSSSRFKGMQRVDLGKGLRATYYQLELQSDSADYELDGVDVYTAHTSRRV